MVDKWCDPPEDSIISRKLPYSKGKTLFPYPYRDLCNYHINKGGLQLLKNLLNDLLYYKIVGEDWEKNGRKLESYSCKSQ